MSTESIASHDALRASGLCTLDPMEVFVPGVVVSDEHDFGTVISATVRPSYQEQIGYQDVSIRILCISESEYEALNTVIARMKDKVHSPAILKYVGVWKRGPEAWLVSERRRQVSARVLFEHIQFADPESIVSYIVNKTLFALRTLHDDHHICHFSIRPASIYICEDASVCIDDIGIYPVLNESVQTRRSCSGTKLWPLPANVSLKYKRGIHSADIWDLGISILTLVDGGASIARSWRSGMQVPHMANPTKWSAQLNSFLARLFTQAPIPTCAELLEHRFVADASATACLAAVAEYFERCADVTADSYRQDIISSLTLRNDVAIQAPLISIDDYSTDLFSYDQWNGADQDRPTVELSIARMLANCKQKPLSVDVEENKGMQKTIATLETFLDTVDAEWNDQ
ncbi:Serine/threonine-protein kinase pakF [Gracilariopsis chorda]|uniref:Serine/threonine-protein kinase pakF n=1 Tax=Gracilariopsis chorda TaxID=448386 RepID=A0A2V3IE54_9FLOR|nr:Serine/threonine-protein kinase pakF [Gracilariopsis chorda]|eukprot:PXF40344.1 Serine/threonine-protein kinase pakF [Gracilariopsis chorda]